MDSQLQPPPPLWRPHAPPDALKPALKACTDILNAAYALRTGLLNKATTPGVTPQEFKDRALSATAQGFVQEINSGLTRLSAEVAAIPDTPPT